MRNAAVFCVILQLAATLVDGEDGDIHVRVAQGLLKGISMKSRNGRDFYGFLKVPYAQPPLGSLRFKAPREPEPWKGVRDATQDGVICTQRNIYVKTKFFVAGQEDCLYLNVFTPKVNQTNEDSLLPVMFFIHGGGWVTGSGNSKYYPPQYLMDKEIVFVSLNYRLGPLGFLSMEDKDLPGNLGLKDQNLALRWVQKNIKVFGGDPNSVTIFGESAGGASVHYHLMSRMSKGLFHRGISQSGTALCSWALGHPGVTRNNTIKLATILECPTSPTPAMVDCLREKPAEDLITTDVHFMEWFKEPMIPFKPVVEKLAKEDRFIEEHPEDAIRNGNVAQVPWITGLNSGDGALRVAGFYDDNKLVEQLDQDFNKIVPMSLFYRESASDVLETTKLIRKFYFGEKGVNNDTYQTVTDLWTDGWFLAGADAAVRLMFEHGKAPVYYYYLSYRGSLSFSSMFGDATRDYGVCHADELLYLFPSERLFPNATFNKLDKKFMSVMLELWTNFAKYGKPTPNKAAGEWEPVSSAGLEYLHLGKDEIAMKVNLLPERTKFWDSLRTNRRLVKDEL